MSDPVPAPTGTLLHGVGGCLSAVEVPTGPGTSRETPWSCQGYSRTQSSAWRGPVGHKQWNLQPCPGQTPGSPRHSYSPLYLEVTTVLPCHVLREPTSAVCSLLFAHQPSSAEGTVPTSTSPGLVAVPQQGFGGQPQSLRCCSLVCAHRHPGRMAWRSWVLLPFLLATGKDSLGICHGWVGGIGAAFTPNTLSPFPGGSCNPKSAACPTGAPGQGRAGQQGKRGGCRCGMGTRARGLGIPLPAMETQTTAGSSGWS